jgi:hypothetical protein
MIMESEHQEQTIIPYHLANAYAINQFHPRIAERASINIKKVMNIVTESLTTASPRCIPCRPIDQPMPILTWDIMCYYLKVKAEEESTAEGIRFID